MHHLFCSKIVVVTLRAHPTTAKSRALTFTLITGISGDIARLCLCNQGIQFLTCGTWKEQTKPIYLTSGQRGLVAWEFLILF